MKNVKRIFNEILKLTPEQQVQLMFPERFGYKPKSFGTIVFDNSWEQTHHAGAHSWTEHNGSENDENPLNVDLISFMELDENKDRFQADISEQQMNEMLSYISEFKYRENISINGYRRFDRSGTW